MPLPTNTRRWQRHEVDLSVTVGLLDGSRPRVRGRATEISEGGLALYAGVDLQPYDLMEIEFLAPSRARVTGVVRNRVGYYFGLEFLTPLPIDKEGDRQDRRPQLLRSESEQVNEPGPLSPAAAKMFDTIKAAKGSAAAYALLARVLQLAGRPGEAEKALDRALTSFFHTRDTVLQQKEFELARLRRQVEILRTMTRLLNGVQRQDQVDPRLPDLVRALPKLLA